MGDADVTAGHGVEPAIPEVGGHRERALGPLNGLVMFPSKTKLPSQMGGHPAQSAAVVQGRRDLLRLTETLEGTPGLPDEVEIMQIEPEVNGLLEPFPVLGKAFKGRERLLETRPRFSVCRALDRLDARLPEVGCRFPPCLGPKRVMREPVDPFGH